MQWLLSLLIFSINLWLVNSYGDPELQDYENGWNESKQVDYQILNHRVRRAAPGQTTDLPTLSTQTNSYSSNAIYIITGSISTGGTSTPSVTTNYNYNGTYIITAFYYNSSSGSTQSTPTTTPSTYCMNQTHILWYNNSVCVARESLINNSLSILYNSSSNGVSKGDALTQYIAAVTNVNSTSSSLTILSIDELDGFVGNLNIPTYINNSTDSIIIATQPKCDNQTVIGASYTAGTGSDIIEFDNLNNITGTTLSAAAYVNFSVACRNISRFNMLIFNNPTVYIVPSGAPNQRLVSSMIMAKVNTGESVTVNVPLTIQLYFQDLRNYSTPDINNYMCAFYDKNISAWNSSGCSPPTYNSDLNRFECQCYHLTSFGLIWQPQSTPDWNKPVELDNQDKASMAFQVFSILCILGVLVYATVVSARHPENMTQPKHLMPLLSAGLIMVLFILYIALGLSVFNRFAGMSINNQTSNGITKSSPLEKRLSARDDSLNSNTTSNVPCTSSEQGLMFAVYFFILFMFCTKTSIGYDNYRRYVKLCPPPTFQLLIGMLFFSFVFSVIWLGAALGTNSNSESPIIQANNKKLCWFTTNYFHIFLTTPICILLAANIILFTLVVIFNIRHSCAHNNDVLVSICAIRKRTMYIILVSAGTQGFGWIFGPLISIVSENAAVIFAWFFIVINGLEGLWMLILYFIIQKNRLDWVKYDKLVDLQEVEGHDDGRFIDTVDLDDLRNLSPLGAVTSDSPRNSLSEYRDSKLSHRISQVDRDNR